MRLSILFAALFFICFSMSAQIVVGKKLENTPSSGYTYKIYPSQNGDWNRTVFLFPGKPREDPSLVFGYTDKEGVLKLILPSSLRFNEYYTDYEGQLSNEVIDTLSEFRDDLAQVTDVVTGLVGFVNRSGNLIVPARFSFAGPFSHGLAYTAVINCEDTNDIGYVNKDGEMQFLLPSKFTQLYMCCYFKGKPFNGTTIEMAMAEHGHDCNCYVKLVMDKDGKVLSHEGELYDASYNKVSID